MQNTKKDDFTFKNLNPKINIQGDKTVWIIILMLNVFSILVVYSSVSSLSYRSSNNIPEYYLIKHIFTISIGLLTMYIVHKINYIYWISISKLGLWFSVILLIITWKFGVNINSASRWIRIPIINTSFQPSDMAQLMLLIYVIYATTRKSYFNKNKAVNCLIGWIVTICGLISLTNFSKSIVLFMACCAIVVMSDLFDKKLVSKMFLSLLILGGVTLGVGQRKATIISRLKIFEKNEITYQNYHAYTAISQGGLVGKGPGNSAQRNFLPYAYSDYIYPIIIEEYGILGGIMLIFLYIVLAYRSLKIVKHGDYGPFPAGLIIYLSFFITLEAAVNIGVSVGLLPSTGLPLPFISMGGTSSLFTSMTYGIILNVMSSTNGYKKSIYNQNQKNVRYRLQ